ncbi:MAG: hypothetical protein V4591_08015, partial [Bdellovibrionota bacterium]
MHDENSLIQYCQKTFNILAEYYDFHSIPSIQEYLLNPSEDSSCVLFEECKDEIYIGIQFAK